MPSILVFPLPSHAPSTEGAPSRWTQGMAGLSSGLPKACRPLRLPKPPTGVPMWKPQSSFRVHKQTYFQILWSPKQIIYRPWPSLLISLKTWPGSVSTSGAFCTWASITSLVHQQPLLAKLPRPVEHQSLSPLMQWVPCSVFLSFSHSSFTFSTFGCQRSRNQ